MDILIRTMFDDNFLPQESPTQCTYRDMEYDEMERIYSRLCWVPTAPLVSSIKSKMSAPRTNLCRLCVNICQDYQPLHDENGCMTIVYEIATKYFDPMFLNADQGDHFIVICSVCWQHISDFHNFQQSVVKAQKQLLSGNVQQIEVIVKSEVEIPPETGNNGNFREMINDDSIKIKTEPEITPTENNLSDKIPACIDDTLPHVFQPAPGENCNASDDITDISTSDMDDELSSEDDDERTRLWEHRNEADHSSISLFASTENTEAQNSKNAVKDKPTETQKLKELDKFIAQHYPDLQCVICSEPCSSFSMLQQHFRSQHPQEKCHIFCCQRRLGSRFQIEEHVHLHNDPNAFQCTICYKSFNGRYSLYSHVYAQHRKSTNAHVTPEEESVEGKARSRKRKSMQLDALIAQWKPTLQCLVCTGPFPNFSLLRQHYRQEHPNEECCLFCCGRKFNDRSKLGEHVRFHVDPNVYKCELCDATHNCKRNLYFHIRTYHPHSRDGMAPDSEQIKKPPRKKRCITITSREIDNSIAQYRPNLECDLCSESCSNFTLLKSHFRLQHPSVPFYIQCCQRKFNNRSEFENHLRLHIDPNAFKCELCGKCLSSIKKLRAHKNRMHFKYQNGNAQDNMDIEVD